MNKNKIILVFCLSFFILAPSIFAQQTEEDTFWDEPLFQEEPITRLEEVQALVKEKKWGEAVPLFQKIIDSPLDPQEYEQGLFGLATCYDEQGNSQKALRYYQILDRQGKSEDLKRQARKRITYYEEFIVGQFHIGDWYPKLVLYEYTEKLAQKYPQYDWHFRYGVPYSILLVYKFFLILVFIFFILLFSAKKYKALADNFQIGWGIPSCFFVFMLFLILQGFLVFFLKPNIQIGEGEFVTLLFELILSYLILTALVLFVLTFRSIPWRKLGINVDHFGKNLAVSAKYMVVIAIFFGLYAFLRSHGVISQDKVTRSYPFSSFGTFFHFFQIFLLMVVSPISEEIFYRGFIYPVVRNRCGFLKGVILTSLFFALVHVNVSSILVLFILSAALCFIYDRTRNLVPAILVHSFYNFMVLFGGSFLPN